MHWSDGTEPGAQVVLPGCLNLKVTSPAKFYKEKIQFTAGPAKPFPRLLLLKLLVSLGKKALMRAMTNFIYWGNLCILGASKHFFLIPNRLAQPHGKHEVTESGLIRTQSHT